MRPAAPGAIPEGNKQFCRALMKVTRIMNMHATALLLTIPRFLISK
ncbi:putative internal head protein (plasmid) [Escherichia coli]|nr:putative internal head protein [Escherichia coli]